ncbi:response regulator [Lusitaniella coriacea LEGE 07157]|uniref:histidine kinase n=1 Tax=Lusitaniella coriacea LEGE 07157 TaxID=945747 RepID=A0A8J7DYQ3_9CYAN|nr:response regulator [Lusitaniella coriacea]MBE9117954.1 response regulator [Lusitaniella coriacea LEGE 07157]
MNQTPSESDRPSILVVDDTPENLRLLVNLLTQKGYKVRAVPSGKLALSGIELSRPDLILLDIMMPEMNGYEVCETLKANDSTKNIPVIFISAMSEVLDKIQAFEVGGVDYVTKPFQAEEVLARVELHLDNRNLQKNLEARNQDLAKALEQLTATQNYLIQSEKMAALGQLVAGIAHEINTPLGAIRASSSNIVRALEESLGEFPKLFGRLSEEQQDVFVSLVDEARSRQKNYGTVPPLETRTRKRALTRQLQKYDIEEARYIADTLMDMGIEGEVEPFLSLLQCPDAEEIVQLAYNFLSLQLNNKNITIAVENASKVVFALKRYAHYDHTGDKQVVDIPESLDTVLELYHNQLKQGVAVRRDYRPLPTLWGYPDELNQVWTNLVQNALHAMKGKGTLEICVDCCDSNIAIEFTDSGSGIPPDIQTRIFDPFFTTKSAGEGSGLGLDIAKKIVEKHKGEIAVNSIPGQTTFKILLPVEEKPRDRGK